MAEAREELTRLAYEMQLYQQQGSALQQQLSALQMTIAEYSASIETLEGIPEAQGKEIMLPIGSGAYVNAKITSTEKVLLNIGSDIVAEKNVSEALEFLKKKKKKLEDTRDRVQKSLIEINSRLQAIDATAKKLMDKESDVQSP